MVRAIRTTVCQTDRTLGVVQGDGVSEPTGTPLNDAGHLTACSWFGFAQAEQGVLAGAFMIVRRRFVTAPEFFNAQMGSDLCGFDPYSLAHFRMGHSAPTYLGFLIFRGLGLAASWLAFGATSQRSDGIWNWPLGGLPTALGLLISPPTGSCSVYVLLGSTPTQRLHLRDNCLVVDSAGAVKRPLVR